MSEVVGALGTAYCPAPGGDEVGMADLVSDCLEPKFQIHTRSAQPGGAMKTKIGHAIATFAETLIEVES